MTRSAADEGAPDLSHVENWVFDLDNTLYPARCNLFAQIDRRMAGFIEAQLGMPPEEARRLQKAYYVRYGTTLSGLMIEHGIAADDFLAHVHDIDVTVLDEDARLRAAIEALPGRRFIFTNGSTRHAERVTEQLGIAGLFDGIFDIRAAGYTPKPHRAAYERFIASHSLAPAASAMFEDIAHNLEAADALGMTTVLVRSDVSWFADEPDAKRPARPGDATGEHIHHVTDDLADFLERAAAPPSGDRS
jgi:putative hydrolase of the HAD superfamily